jgi:hypothetical protein
MSFWNLTGNLGIKRSTNFLGTTDDNPLVIATNGKEAVHIDQSGNVGLGTNEPGVKLHVKGDRIRLQSVDNSRILDIRADGSALDIGSNGAPLFINGTKESTFLNPNGGNVGVGMVNPKYPLDINGITNIKNGSLFVDNGVWTQNLLVALWGSVGAIIVGSNARTHFLGYVEKAGGGFNIDHPLDPANKYLNHGFVESPKMKNIYDGVITLDGNGEATVEMPEWFEHVNQDFCYQLTGIGKPSPNLYVAEEISNNRFKIAGGSENQKVSWQVTGVRNDPWARKNSLPIEQNKPQNERGYYLHPDLYNQPEERNLMRLRYPMQVPQ